MNDLLPNPAAQNLNDSLRRAYPIVYNALRSRFRDEQLADEVCQECIGKAYEYAQADPSYFDGQDVIEWITRRARWRALDQLRRRGRAKELTDDNAEGAVPARRHQAEEREANRRLAWECLQRLPEEERVVLLGHHYDGLTDQELGTRLFGEGLSRQARGLRVWRLRRRAYDHLRALLLAEGFDPADAGPAGGQAV